MNNNGNNADGKEPDWMMRVQRAADALRNGGMVILADDPDRENEGDIIFASQFCEAEHINFMREHARGMICAPLTAKRLEELQIPMMVDENTSTLGTAMAVSVDALQGTTTGISAADMSRTIRLLADPATRPQDLQRPGHVVPLRYRDGGVLVRMGQTEGSIDLARIAGVYPATVVCEICNPDGTMARQTELEELSSRFNLPLVHVKDVLRYREATETGNEKHDDGRLRRIERIEDASLPTRYGEFRIVGYEIPGTDEHHVALVMGEVSDGEDILCRMHSECLTGDVFHSARCDCGDQLELALTAIAEAGRGVLLYLRQEGRGIGLINKIRAYSLQDQGMDTYDANIALGLPADKREYWMGNAMLEDLGVKSIRLMTNNPAKIIGLESFRVRVSGRVPVPINKQIRPELARYLRTKVEKMDHRLDLDEIDESSLLSGQHGKNS
jgi:3,4-dihydroxy 2-butanone 4-phosphate synthase/GTP cyclohydrolase II